MVGNWNSAGSAEYDIGQSTIVFQNSHCMTGVTMRLLSNFLTILSIIFTLDATGLADRPHWLWSHNENAKAGEQVMLRKTFQVTGRTIGAALYATGDDELVVYINGKEAMKQAGWDRPAFKDVKDLIKPGKNIIAVLGKNSAPSPAGVLVKLDIEPRGKKAISIVSDETWKVAQTAEKNWKQIQFDDSNWAMATSRGQIGAAPWTKVTEVTLAAASKLREPTATPIDQLVIKEGFNVELLYSVPKDEQGSWVSMTTDPKGRLIVCDQYGGLFRVTLPYVDKSLKELKIEKIPAKIGEAQGLVWAFDALYVVVNKGFQYESGLYRVTDKDGDDVLESVETLVTLNKTGGEHGPHAIMKSPDGQSLYIVAGNATSLPEIHSSRVPQVWDEDLLLPRTYGRGFMKGVPAPGGWICKIDPDAKHWELIATGFRNEYDAAFNRHGDLFTYDADMEWDMNTPWYRPTRICQVSSGAEFGWRNGSGKWPAYYEDSLPAVHDIGPGSPTGVCFGYGAAFPKKYQDALFACDWSYGKLYAVHLEPHGASYSVKSQEFITGTPLPLTDILINPMDKAMYFTIGGRKTKSGLYRVTYTGKEPTEYVKPEPLCDENAAARRKLEQFHGVQNDRAVETAWPYLSSADRFLRFAARIAVEHQPVHQWREKALGETNPQGAITALIALARHGEKSIQPAILKSLDRIDASKLSDSLKTQLLRAYTVAFSRMGEPNQETKTALLAKFEGMFPSKNQALNSELCQLLVYLGSEQIAAKAVPLLDDSSTQEEQIDFAKSLRHLKAGWTPKLQQDYFNWFVRAMSFRGGASFSMFVENIKKDAVGNLSAADKQALKPILEKKPEAIELGTGKPRPFVKEWKFNELLPLVEGKLTNRSFKNGRAMFAAAKCFSCHRFDNRGGAIGPDLSGVAGRFSKRDLLESTVLPSKVISDQYSAVTIITDDGKIVTGRIVNLAGDTYRINTNMLDPDALAIVDRKNIVEMVKSDISMMPQGLLNTLSEEEILDLMAYLLSRGDAKSPMFNQE